LFTKSDMPPTPPSVSAVAPKPNNFKKSRLEIVLFPEIAIIYTGLGIYTS
jgi:hypothetical protein